MTHTDRQSSLIYWFLSLAMIAAVTAIRFWFITSGQINLAPDEAQYWDWSRTLQWSFYSKGPLIAVINKIGTAYMGATETGVRIGALVSSATMQLAVLGWVGGYMQRARTAFWALFIMNTSLLFMAGSVLMTTDNPLLLFWIVGLFCLHLAVDRGHSLSFVILGLCVALGITAKYTMLLFPPLAVIAAFWIGRRQPLPQKFWSRLLKTLLIGTVLGLLPILIWNFQNDWVGIKHVLYRGGMAGDKAEVFFRYKHFPEYLGGQLAVITPWWFVFLMAGAWQMLRGMSGTGISDQPASTVPEDAEQSEQTCEEPQSEPITEKAISDPVRPNRTISILTTVFFWPGWFFFLFWSLHTKVEANWSASAYPAGFLMAAMAFERFMHRVPRPRFAAAWPVLAVVVFAVVHLHGLIPMDIPKSPTNRLLGWKDMGHQVGQVVDALGGTNSTFVFADEYGVTSELSFYVPGQQRAYCLAGSRKMNQYDFWPGPDASMQNGVFVVKGEKNHTPEGVLSLFEEVDEPEIVHTREGIHSGLTFSLYRCRGYKGVWPEQDGKTF